MSYEIEQKICSKNAWFTPEESNAYYKARYVRDDVAIHWWGGGETADKHDSIVNYFLAQAEAGVKSVNYVCSDNKITEMVDPDNVAWCTETGNPVSVSIEFQPTLSDEGYKRGGYLIAMLEKKYGHSMPLFGHSHWFATSCPGSIDIARLRKEADAAAAGVTVTPTPAPTPTNPQVTPATASDSGAKTVTLPANVATWALYRVGSQLRKGTSDQIAILTPPTFGGITYDIVSWVGDYAVVVNTQMFGQGVIWVKDTEAQFGGTATGTSAPASAPAATGSGTLVLPNSVATWRVYNVGGPWTVGNEIGTLLPSKFDHNLEYAILGHPATNIYIINTDSYGTVAIYAGPDTEAQFK